MDVSVLQSAVRRSNVREVHAHVSEFDGTESPPGFAAVVLIDESHVSAHCYAEEGFLPDCFTCGGFNPNKIADDIHQQILIKNQNLSRPTNPKLRGLFGFKFSN
ncbi:MAG: hypothetical protein Ct9H90mP16_11940 [Candidatus Poseidoniales archaeon]|nr:MAG: hypothetical protein Ct9H90mP16_11940 [Candidatus Poseidoniales archaeon]